MLAKAKEKLSAASDVTARQAQKTKLKGEIMVLQGRITTAKKDFGPAVYAAMVDSINGPEVDRLFNATRQKVEALQADIDVGACRDAGEDLDQLGYVGDQKVAPPARERVALLLERCMLLPQLAMEPAERAEHVGVELGGDEDEDVVAEEGERGAELRLGLAQLPLQAGAAEGLDVGRGRPVARVAHPS